VTNGATSAGARDQRRCQDRGPPLASCPLPRPPPSAVAGHVGPQAQGPRHRRLDLDGWPGPGRLAARNSTPITRLSLLGGRPRDLFSEMIAPWVKISPPQTPCGSWRSTAPARQNRRIGQGWQYALASSRSVGRSENHSCGFSRWQGSGSSSAFACLASRATELTMMRYRPGSGAVGVRPSDRARSVPGRLRRRAIRWARTMSGSRASAVSGSCCPLADPRWRLAFCICFMCALPFR
jgi:hypothetical protein